MSEIQKEYTLNKLLMGAIIGLLSWNVYTTHSLSISLAVLNEKVNQIERIINNG